jgi:hypothetical protein
LKENPKAAILKNKNVDKKKKLVFFAGPDLMRLSVISTSYWPHCCIAMYWL